MLFIPHERFAFPHSLPKLCVSGLVFNFHSQAKISSLQPIIMKLSNLAMVVASCLALTTALPQPNPNPNIVVEAILRDDEIKNGADGTLSDFHVRQALWLMGS